MRVTLDWDDAPSLAANFSEAVRGLTGPSDIWDLSASANGEPVAPSELIDAVDDGDDPEDIQAALSAFAEARGDSVSPTTLREVADQLDLETLPDGSHFAGYGNTLSLSGMLNLRGAFGDDGRRLDLDRDRLERGSPHLQLLFDRKYIKRTEDPANVEPGDDIDAWQSGTPARYVAGASIVDSSERIKDESGRIDYVRVIEILSSDEYFGSRAELYRQIQGRKNTPDTRPSQRGYQHVNGLRPIQRAEKKALRDYAEDRDIGHYGGGRARDVTYSDDLPTGVASRRRRALVEYVDVVWDDGDGGDRDAGDDYFRELNITTSTVNENNTNRQLKVTHDKAVQRAMDRLNPTSPRNDVTLKHRRDRAANIGQSDGRPPMGEMGRASRNPDSLNWEDRRLDADEVENYLDNLPVDGRPNAVAERERAETNPIVEVTLNGEDPVNDDPEWHVLLIDDGNRLSDATVIRDSRGWW